MTFPSLDAPSPIPMTSSAPPPAPTSSPGPRHAAEPGPLDPTTQLPVTTRYVLETIIGRGGVGEVFLAQDTELGRQVAVKVLRSDHTSREARQAFVAEAQAMSQLQHPGVPAIHDLGRLPNGRLFFAMQLIRGRTLREVLHDLLLRRRAVVRRYSLHRLVTALQQVAQTIHFAHERGVIHRDIKPGNVMFGDYGEVHVMDWGLAEIETRDSALDGPSVDQTVIVSPRLTSPMMPRSTGIRGTVQYMAPEMADGTREPTVASDVFSLGCLLYEAIALYPPYRADGDAQALLERVRRGEITPIRDRNPDRPVPEPLARVVDGCLALDPEARFDSLEDVADALGAWLDGRDERVRRKGAVRRLVRLARAEGKRLARCHERLRDAQRDLGRAVEDTPAWAPDEERTRVRELRDAVTSHRQQARLAFAETSWLYAAAVSQDPQHLEARQELVSLWLDALRRAERRGDEGAIAYARAMAQRFGGKLMAARIRGQGRLTLDVDPPDAVVTIQAQRLEHGVYVPDGPPQPLVLPCVEHRLPAGTHLVRAHRPDEEQEIVYPVHIERDGLWAARLRLRPDDGRIPGAVRIPAGPFQSGSRRPLESVDLRDYAMQVHPVTLGAWCAWLDALDASESQDAADARVPRTQRTGPLAERTEAGWRPRVSMLPSASRAHFLETCGPEFAGQIPVVGILLDDAHAYCAWRSLTTGTAWQVPTSHEMEKALRGVDGRSFPWGEAPDPTRAVCRDTDARPPSIAPVGSHPGARSIYGVEGAVGNVWCWTRTPHPEFPSMQIVRGGSAQNSIEGLRCGTETWADPSNRFSFIGLRCVIRLT